MQTPTPSSKLREQVLRRVDASILLSQERKDALRTATPTLSDAKLEKILTHLMGEDAVILDIITRAITAATERGDHAFLVDLDRTLSKALRSIKRAEEQDDIAHESSKTDSLFPALS